MFFAIYAKVSFEKATLALSSKLFNINTINFPIKIRDRCMDFYTLGVRNLGQDALASRTRLMRMYGHHKTH